MPNTQETLSIFAEVAVALAGFSGIVIAFARRSLGALSPLESRRLYNLYFASGLVLLSSLLGISLLHAEPLEAPFLWRGGSTLVLIFGIPWIFFDWHKVRGLEEAERADVKAYIFYPFIIIGILFLILQILNVFVLGQSWPFFVALVFLIAFAFQQFILMVRMGFHDV